MLEIKDKEKSALKALEVLRTYKYFVSIDSGQLSVTMN
jgi:hypothetical protein